MEFPDQPGRPGAARRAGAVRQRGRRWLHGGEAGRRPVRHDPRRPRVHDRRSSCTPAQQLGGQQFPQTLTLADGDQATIGPLLTGTTCTVAETNTQGATVSISQPTVTIPADDGVTVTVDQHVPGWDRRGRQDRRASGPDLPADLIAPGTPYPVEIRCTYPTTPGFPNAGQPIPGFNPLLETITSGQPGSGWYASDVRSAPCRFAVHRDRAERHQQRRHRGRHPARAASDDHRRGTTPVERDGHQHLRARGASRSSRSSRAPPFRRTRSSSPQVQCTFEGQQVKNERVPFSVSNAGDRQQHPAGEHLHGHRGRHQRRRPDVQPRRALPGQRTRSRGDDHQHVRHW